MVRLYCDSCVTLTLPWEIIDHHPSLSTKTSIAWEKEGVLAVKATIDKIWKDMEKKCGRILVEVKKTQHRYVTGP